MKNKQPFKKEDTLWNSQTLNLVTKKLLKGLKSGKSKESEKFEFVLIGGKECKKKTNAGKNQGLCHQMALTRKKADRRNKIIQKRKVSKPGNIGEKKSGHQGSSSLLRRRK